MTFTFSVSRAVEIFKTRVFIQGELDKMIFEDLNVNKELVQGLKEMGLKEPTEIQEKATGKRCNKYIKDRLWEDSCFWYYNTGKCKTRSRCTIPYCCSGERTGSADI